MIAMLIHFLCRFLVFVPLLFSGSAFALSLEQSISPTSTTLRIALDSPGQIVCLRRPSPTKLRFPLNGSSPKPLVWIAEDDSALLRAVHLTDTSLDILIKPRTKFVLERSSSSLTLTLRPKPALLETSEPLRFAEHTSPITNHKLARTPEEIVSKERSEEEAREESSDFEEREESTPEYFLEENASFDSETAETVRTLLHDTPVIPYSEIKTRLEGEGIPFQTKWPGESVPPKKEEENTVIQLWHDLTSFFIQDALAEENKKNTRAYSVNPQDIRAPINTGGPENWPSSESITTHIGENHSEPAPSGGEKTSEHEQTFSQELPESPFPPKEEIRRGHDIPVDSGIRRGHDIPNDSGIQHGHSFPNDSPNDSAIHHGHDIPSEKGKEDTPKESLKNEAPLAPPARENPAVSPKEAPKQPSSKEVRSAASQEKEGFVEEKKDEKAEEAKEAVEVPTIYVDEEGNPVEKPIDIPALFKEAEQLVEEKKYDDAILALQKIRELPDLLPDMRERVLYYISDCYWNRYERDLMAGFDDIMRSTNEALNNNLRSPKVPDALLRLCLINLAVDNVSDARAYSAALLRRFPSYPGNPAALAALGKAELKQKLYPQAERSFNTILDKYPESSQLRDASVGLIYACTKQGKYDRSQLILDFVNKRWPRYFADDPDFLLVQSEIEDHYNQNERSMQTLWHLINLVPKHEKIVPLFLNLADRYLRANNEKAANYLYTRILQMAPESNEALTAKLRLVEKGFYPSPLKQETMFTLFGRGSQPPFPEVYADVANASKTYPDSVLSRLKLALWLLWDQQQIEAMTQAAEFIDEYPEHSDKKVAEDIIWQAFQKELLTCLTEENYGRILVLWNGFPLIRKRYGEPDAKMRFALAQAYKERGDIENSQKYLRTFLTESMDSDYGEIAFLEFFNKYLAEADWNRILDLGKTVEKWDLPAHLRYDLDYAMALSAQNLNLTRLALDLWRKISQNRDCPLYQQAWAMVFLAQNAERNKDIKRAYDYNLKVVEFFTQLQDERSDKADPNRIKSSLTSLMDICEVANHIPEALQWVNRFRDYAPPKSADYPALRYREARLYRKLGDTNRAQAILEELIRNYADSPYAKAAQSELNSFSISRDLQSFRPSSSATQ